MTQLVLFVQSDLYGELEHNVLRTARIPPFYQDCDRDGGLAGCLMKYDNPQQQCSKGRSG